MLRMMFGAKRLVAASEDGLASATARTSSSNSSSSSSRSSTSSNCSDSEDESVALEPWSEFITRITHRIDACMLTFSMEDWIVTHRRRKWRFAGRTARCTDGRWSTRMLKWQPVFGEGRCAGRPCTRWDDCIVSLAGLDWISQALDEHIWKMGEEAYVIREESVESLRPFGRQSQH